MPHVAVFLRAINVHGRRVTNDQLVALVAGAGFDEVSAHQAAGNLVLDPGDRDTARVRADVEDALATGLGYTAEAFVRTAAELDEVLGRAPFDAVAVEAAQAKPQIAFLAAAPDATATQAVMTHSSDADHLAVHGTELHWLPVGGVGRSALDLTALGRVLGPMTVRTEGTVRRIRAKLA